MQSMAAEAPCSACVLPFKQPALLACGHRFCRACLELCWEEEEEEESGFACVRCRATTRARTFRRCGLGDLMELVKYLEPDAAVAWPEVARGVCRRHRESLTLFCREDETPICITCRESDHRAHQVLPMEEAAQVYKEEIQSELWKLEMQLKDPINAKERLDIDDILRRFRDFQKPMSTSKQNIAGLKVKLNKFKESFTSHLKKSERQQMKAAELNANIFRAPSYLQLDKGSQTDHETAEDQKCHPAAPSSLQMDKGMQTDHETAEDIDVVSRMPLPNNHHPAQDPRVDSFISPATPAASPQSSSQAVVTHLTPTGTLIYDPSEEQKPFLSSLPISPVSVPGNRRCQQTVCLPVPPGSRLIVPVEQIPDQGLDRTATVTVHAPWAPRELYKLVKGFPNIREEPEKFKRELELVIICYDPTWADLNQLLRAVVPSEMSYNLKAEAQWPAEDPGIGPALTQARTQLSEAVLKVCPRKVDWDTIYKQKKGETPANYMERVMQFFCRYVGIDYTEEYTVPVAQIFVRGLAPKVKERLQSIGEDWECKPLKVLVESAEKCVAHLEGKKEMAETKLRDLQIQYYESLMTRGYRQNKGREWHPGGVDGTACYYCGREGHWKNECPDRV